VWFFVIRASLVICHWNFVNLSHVAAENVNHIAIGWLAFITLLRGTINLFGSKHAATADEEKFRIGFLRVTCHPTCRVTDFINKGVASRNPQFSLVRILR